jgi:predicted HAD superfamily phosphohydrolase YqeG
MKRLEKDIGKKTLVLDLDETIIHCYENLEIQTDLTLAMNI